MTGKRIREMLDIHGVFWYNDNTYQACYLSGCGRPKTI